MNSLREFISSSSGLAPLRQGLGLGWVISALTGLAILFGASEAAEADRCENRTYDDCRYDPWCASWDENTPIRCRTTRVDCSFDHYCISYSEAEQAGACLNPPKTECSYHNGCAESYPTKPYRYCTTSYDADDDSYQRHCKCSSTPCSEAEQPTATAEQAAPCLDLTSKTKCGYYNGCARSDSTEPYRYCTTYQDDYDNVYWFHCECSSTPCSEAEQPTATAVQTSADARPAQHRLGASYPNPFNPAMVIPLALATDQTRVHLVLYDVLGRRVRQVWQGPLRAGSHRFVWDGRDEGGKAVAAGVYIYKVEVEGWVEAKKTTKLP